MSSTIIPTLRYRDASRMIDSLCDVFGFTRRRDAEGHLWNIGTCDPWKAPS
ncbi:MAG: hypothetical protein WAL40_15225 [Rhodoplanes sp.]|jgi:uncharacterized glyoxalase superfamily protein PhnB